MPRISKKPQVKQSHAVSTVSFQAHVFSDGESIRLKLLWRARFHKLRRPATERASLSACPRSRAFSNKAGNCR
jgi:hypothetical protein